jgi:hypothetical protein
MFKKALLPFLLILIFLTACAPAATPAPNAQFQTDTTGKSAAPALEAPSSSGGSAKPADSTIATLPDQSSVTRLVIRNAELSIYVKDPGSALDQIAKMADGMQGYTVSSNLYKSTPTDGNEFPEAKINIRVPAEKLNDALTKIKALVTDPGTDITNESVTGQDVTKEYTDQKSRLTNLENAEKQLQKIMDEAVKTEDVLNVYNQLVSIREQIEVIKGQIKYYEESAALSSIQVSILAKASARALTIGGWEPVGVARSALQATLNGLRFLANAAIWIVLFIVPIGLVIFIPLRLLWALAKRLFKRKGNRPVAPPANPPAAG